MHSNPTFSWSNLPADLVRSFARELGEARRPSTDAAIALLDKRVGVPDEDFFRHFGVRSTAVQVWLSNDEAALSDVYAQVAPRSGSARAPTRRQRLSAVRKCVDPPPGKRQTAAVRRALAAALLRAGGGHYTGAEPVLRPYSVMPTRTSEAPSLEPHQRRVVDALRESYDRQGDDLVGMVVMPTGAGKTITAVHWLLDQPVRRGAKVLWVTHRQELLDQTAGAFARCAPVLADDRDRVSMRLIGAGYAPASTIADDAHDVVVASIGALARNMPAVRRYLRDHRCVVVLDEAHHAVARTWRQVVALAREETKDAVVGLTATPTRMGVDEQLMLGKLFERTIADVSVAELQASGFLAQAMTRQVDTAIDVEALADEADFRHLERFRDLSPRLASALAENVPRNRLIVEEYLRGFPGTADGYGQTIVFAVTVQHAHLLAADFARAGVPAAALAAADSRIYEPSGPGAGADVAREAALEAFRSGDVRVIVNVQVLTEGVDVPSARSAFLARPTGSQVLMSQMVGRVLRGEAVGGTAHAYLVSFRDHWERFPDWADPTRLLEGELEASPGSGEATGERHDRPNELTDSDRQALFDAAAAEARQGVAAHIAGEWIRIPVGVFLFEVELPVAREQDNDVLEARRVDLVVHEHDEAGYDSLAEALAAGDLSADVDTWLTSHFADVPEPLPVRSRLEHLARYIATEGVMPRFVRLEGREAVDPRYVAKQLIDADARPSEREAAIRAAYDRNVALVDTFYGGLDSFRHIVIDELHRRELRERSGFDEQRVPYLRAGDRLDHRFGQKRHDLDELLDRVLADPALFPAGLDRPAGGIRWTARPFKSVWARYVYEAKRAGAEALPYVEVNILLDAETVDEDIVELLIYHELLHHQDISGGKVHPETGKPHSPHDAEFRRREALHPAKAKADAWMDTFGDRLLAVAAERPAQ